MDLLNDLNRMGFTEYEAKVYLALLSSSPATGYQVSKTSGVPRSMVYDALSRLHTRGAILESIEGRAAIYRPLPPEVLLARERDEHEQLIERLRTGLTSHQNALQGERVWSLSGHRPILSYAVQLIDRSRSEVHVVLTDPDLMHLKPSLLLASQRNVAVHALLTGEGTLECGEVAYHPPLESSLQGLTGMLLVVVDGHEVLIADAEHDRATVTANVHLVGIARQFVWMEFFTQRIYARLGSDLLDRLELEDRSIFESLRALKERDGERKGDRSSTSH
jgi:Cd2+/Zn2+-exporting ATPase